MSLSRQLLLMVGVSVILGLGARGIQKSNVPFWGFPKPLEMITPKDAIAVEGVSPDSAFAPADKPYKVNLATTMGLYMKRKKNNVHFIDARESKLYGEGHIPGAVNIPFEHLAEQEAIAIPKDDLVVLYCDGGDCHLSNDLAAYMLEGGWKRVAVYEGGWAEWSTETEFVATGAEAEPAK
jgi:rhodanese-related sulfurtransferase